MKVLKNKIFESTWSVVKHSPNGEFLGVVSGMGKNKGTWGSEAKSLRTAQRWVKQLRDEDKLNFYTIEEN